MYCWAGLRSSATGIWSLGTVARVGQKRPWIVWRSYVTADCFVTGWAQPSAG